MFKNLLAKSPRKQKPLKKLNLNNIPLELYILLKNKINIRKN